MKHALAAVLALGLSACAGQPIIWYHQHGSEARYQTDVRECRFEAIRASAPVVRGGVLETELERASVGGMVAIACMEARGYTQTPSGR
jgi:hypothetical protein